jgi:probable HAF family extracellular repeat protein
MKFARGTKQVFVAAAITVGVMPVVSADAQAFFSGLGDLPGGHFESAANDVSTDGQTVVGWSVSRFGKEAFRWTASTGMVGLGALPGAPVSDSQARGVSGDGSIVAGRSAGTVLWLPFVWTQSGGMIRQTLPPNTGAGSVETVSADGTAMAGFVWTGVGQAATLWRKGTNPRLLGDLPGGSVSSTAVDASKDGAVVVGHSSAALGIEAFVWTDGAGIRGIGDFPGGAFSSEARGVSGDGLTVVGRGSSPNEVREAFFWTEAIGMVPLGHLPGAERNSSAYACSDDGAVIVGGGDTSIYPTRAFLWTQSTGMIDLKDLLMGQGLDLTGWTLMRAVDISGDGTSIVGWGRSPRTLREAWIAHVPAIACKADCDRSTGFGTLDIFDFLCFQSLFVRQQPYACDCDVSTGVGVCDVFDFLCFQTRFVGGCR